MTSTIKVDNIQKVSDASNIIKKCSSTTTIGSGSGNTVVVCGSTVTIGRCGGTVALASGASQSGFGRSGSVNWPTTKKTANFTAVSGEGYFCDTAATGAFTLTLPASPTAGDIVALKDYNSNFNTANLTIGRNGSNLNGAASDKVLDTNNLSLTLVYVDATEGWIPTEEGTGFVGLTFMTATGGTITTCGNDKIHTFTSPGTFEVTSLSCGPTNNVVAYMVVAGGGGGGRYSAAAGGAGGFREGKNNPITPYTASPLAAACSALPVSLTSYPVTVGAGGATHPSPNPGGPGSNGSNSIFSTITSAGGGYGSGGNGTNSPGGPGGSGGGSGGTSDGGSAGSGNTPPVSPPQGNNGGVRAGQYGAGGGGAGAVGGNSGGPYGFGVGGAGVGTGINPAPGNGSPGPCGSLRYFAGGGGAAGVPGNCGPTSWGAGGGGCGGTGKTGVVIIRYKFQ